MAAGRSRSPDGFLRGVLDEIEEEETGGAPDAAAAARAAAAASSGAARSGAARRPAGPGGSAAATSSSASAAAEGLPEDEQLSEALAQMMREMQGPDFQRTLQDTLKGMADSGTGGPGLFGGVGGGGPTEGGGAGGDLDANVHQTMEMLARLSAGGESGDAEKLSEEVMKSMMDEFEKMGQKEDFQSVVDNMMRQLLSKDIMYEPVKQIAEQFPRWLAANADKITRAEYDNYGKQYQIFQLLSATYETEPDNFARIFELVQDLQETGQPPAEIIKELAPGLDIGPEGMPMLPSMGPGVPGLPGMPGGACSIM